MEKQILETEYNYFRSHLKEFAVNYLGKYLLIVGEELKGVFDDIMEGYIKGENDYGVGNFLLTESVADESDLIQTYCSPLVYFNN